MPISLYAAAGRVAGGVTFALISVLLFSAVPEELAAADPAARNGIQGVPVGDCSDIEGNPLTAGTPCRFAIEVCDVPEVCDGISDVCPSDQYQPPGVECRAGSGDLCDPPETCSGDSQFCPSDDVASWGTVCNPGSGDSCDPDEVCSGYAGDPCPLDWYESHNFVCNEGSGDTCDPDEVCPGIPDQTCPNDNVEQAGIVCRVGSLDQCDPNEYCTGTADEACPADIVRAAGTVCGGDLSNSCDVAERCTGIPGDDCQDDVVRPAGSLCRYGSGDQCDPPEYCTGTPGEDCPIDYIRPAGYVCNPGSGDFCDPDETCPGTVNGRCPIDFVQPASEPCRESGTGDLICDPPEFCTGTADDACPDDFVEPVTTPCGDGTGTACSAPDSCDGLGECSDNNIPCGMFTDSSLCDFDAEPDKGVCEDTVGGALDGDACSLAAGNEDCELSEDDGGTCVQSSQFRLAFTPNMQAWVSYKLNASTPGQFFYNLIYDASGASDGATLFIGVPYPFVTQGAVPLHVYDADLLETDENGCFEPPQALLGAPTVITLADWIQGTGYSPPDHIPFCVKVDDGVDDHDGGTDVCVIEVEIPQAAIDATLNGLLYVNLHVDYGLKGPGVDADGDGYADRYDRAGSVSPWNSSDALFDTATNDDDVAIEDCSDHSFWYSDDGILLQGEDGAENLNVFKRPAGAFGHAYCEDNGDPLAGYVQLRRQGSNTALLTTAIDADGYYRLAYTHKGKAAQYYLAWCPNQTCAGFSYYDRTEPFWLQANGFAEVDLVDLTAAPCDGTPADLQLITPIYTTGKFKY